MKNKENPDAVLENLSRRCGGVPVYGGHGADQLLPELFRTAGALAALQLVLKEKK